MSVSGLFNIGTSALRAAYVQLQTTGNNIANADTPGYSRQRVEQATTSQYFSGSGFIGRGVDVITVSRLYDRFLAARVQSGTAAAAGDAARASQLEQLENLIGTQSGGIGAALDAFRMSLADLVNQPADLSTRTVAVGRAQALAERFRSMSSGIEEIGRSVEARLADGIGALNSLLRQVSSLNQEIARVHGSGHTPNDLLDQRDALVEQVNGLVRVSTTQNADGSINLIGAGGHGLLVGNSVATLSLQPDPLDPTRSRPVLETSGQAVPLSSSLLGGGELGGLLRFRDDDLAAARYGLGQLAGAVAGAYNATHALGVDANGDPGGDLFAVGASQVDAAAGNTGAAAFTVSITDAKLLAASDYRIDWDGSQYSITRLSDGQQTAVAGWPATIDGLQFDLDPAAGVPATGDRFLVRSASMMAGGFAAVLGSAQQLATGLAGVADPAADNRNARALVGLGDLGLVQGRRFTDAWAAVLADTGQRSQVAAGSAQLSAAVLADARSALGEVSGVNLDEEAARLLQYQQSYQAAAKVIATAQTVFDTLLDIAR